MSIFLDGYNRHSLRAVFRECFGSVDDETYQRVVEQYFGGWVLIDLNANYHYEIPVEPSSVLDAFWQYATDNELGDAWEGIFKNWTEERGLFDKDVKESDTKRFIIHIADDLLIPEHLVKLGW